MKSQLAVAIACAFAMGVAAAAGESETSASQAEGATQGQMSEQLPSFSKLDKDGDGHLIERDIEKGSPLEKHWSKVDENGDGRVDQAEFSAFTQGQSQGGGQSGQN